MTNFSMRQSYFFGFACLGLVFLAPSIAAKESNWTKTAGDLRDSVLHRYAQYCNVVRERLLIDH